MNKGWKNESARHSLAARGMKTRCKAPRKSLILSSYGEVIGATPEEWKHQFEKLTLHIKRDFDNSFDETKKAIEQDYAEGLLAGLSGRESGIASERDKVAIWLTSANWETETNEKYREKVKSLSHELQKDWDEADREYSRELHKGLQRSERKLRYFEGKRNGIGRVKDLFMHYMQQWSR